MKSNKTWNEFYRVDLLNFNHFSFITLNLVVDCHCQPNESSPSFYLDNRVSFGKQLANFELFFLLQNTIHANELQFVAIVEKHAQVLKKEEIFMIFVLEFTTVAV